MASDDATLRIVLEDSSGPGYTTGADIPGVGPPPRKPPSSPPVSSSPDDDSGQSRFYRRYPWAKLGGKPSVLPPGASSGIPGDRGTDRGPLPTEPWAGANENPMGSSGQQGKSKARQAYEFFSAGPKDHIPPKSEDLEGLGEERKSFKEWMDAKAGGGGRGGGGGRRGGGGVPGGAEDDGDSMWSRFTKGFMSSVGPATGAAVGSATGSPTLGAVVGSAAGGGAEALFGAIGPAGIALAALGTAALVTVEAFNKLNDQAEFLTQSIVKVSGQVAGAEAQREVAQVQSQLRRDAEIGDLLADYVRRQTEIEQKWEEVRNRVYKLLSPLEEFGQRIVSGLEDLLLGVLPAVEKYTADPGKDLKGIGSLMDMLAMIKTDGTLNTNQDPMVPNSTF